MAMTTATTASDATTSNQISRITRDEFVQQGIDIVHAYAEDCHLSVVFPEHSPAQLAEWIWRRRADKNGTIPLLPQHIAARLSDGQLRIMHRNSENKPVYPVPDPTLDEADLYRPVVPPDLDDAYPLPAPFLRSRHDRPDAAETSSGDEEEYSLPANGFPLDKFPSPPPDTHSPPIRPIRNLAPSEFSSSPELATPELDIVYPPREASVIGENGIHGQKISHKMLCKMLEQVRNKRRQIKRMLDDAQADLAQAVLEVQMARNDLTLSIADSRKTLERLKQLFGTKRTLQVLDVIQRGREGRFRRSDFDNSDPPQNASQDGSSQYDDGSTGSRPELWSSRASEPAINENTIVPNVTITMPSPPNDTPITTNQKPNEQVNNVVAEFPSEAIAGAEVPSQTHDTMIGTSHHEAEFGAVPLPLAVTATEDRRSNSYHLRGSRSSRSSRKRIRDENEDSEAEVERSILCDIIPASSKRRRLNGATRSENTSRSKSKARARTRNPGDQRFAQKPKSGEIAKDRRLTRENAVFLSTPSPFRLRHVRGSDRARIAPLIAHLGLDEAEQPPSRPEGQTSLAHPRRPLTRSTSRILSYEDGGYLYVKH